MKGVRGCVYVLWLGVKGIRRWVTMSVWGPGVKILGGYCI